MGGIFFGVGGNFLVSVNFFVFVGGIVFWCGLNFFCVCGKCRRNSVFCVPEGGMFFDVHWSGIFLRERVRLGWQNAYDRFFLCRAELFFGGERNFFCGGRNSFIGEE